MNRLEKHLVASLGLLPREDVVFVTRWRRVRWEALLAEIKRTQEHLRHMRARGVPCVQERHALHALYRLHTLHRVPATHGVHQT